MEPSSWHRSSMRRPRKVVSLTSSSMPHQGPTSDDDLAEVCADHPTQGRSIEQRIRDAFREPHPFARKAALLKAHEVPWLSVYAKRTMRTAVVFVPLAVVVLGWPFAARWVVEISNGTFFTNRPKPAVEHEPTKSHKITRRAMLQEGPVKLES